MTKHRTPVPDLIPGLPALPFFKAGRTAGIVLTEHQRRELGKIGTLVQLPARAAVYAEGAQAEFVFAVAEGAVKSYRELANGRRLVSAFLFQRDLFGLAADGRYVNSTRAITAIAVHRFPIDDLAHMLKHDGTLQFEFLAKVTHELREAQRRALLLTRRDAPGRLAMFVTLMAERVDGGAKTGSAIPLPMTRSDIAGFLGLSLESVSRAAAELQRRRIVNFEGRHVARVIDGAALRKLAAAV